MPLVSLVAVAAASVALVIDIRTRRIPNWLTASAFMLGLVLNALAGGLQGFALALAGAALGILLLLPFYVMNAMGAGDVKLLAAIGALVGPQALVSVAIYGAIVGGIMSVAILANRGRIGLVLHQVLSMRVMPTRSGAKAPYAVAIASGVYLSMLLPSVVP